MRKKKTSDKKYIILNNVYAGRYGLDQRNLPHEIINFFRADNDNFYVFVTPYGVLNKEIRKRNIKAILFIRSVGDSLVEVLAKAEIGDGQTDKNDFPTQGLTLHKDGSINGKKPVFEDVKYGGKWLKDIHSQNNSDNGIPYTMRVSSISLPKTSIYISHKKNINGAWELQGSKKSNNQSMKAYYEKIEDKKAYCTLCEIIDKCELWKTSNETQKYDAIKDSIADDDNFFKVTLQQDNEVMFSNMFYYYFCKYPEFARSFAKEVLKVDIQGEFVVDREKERMDIRLISDDKYIIIENKIKSQINGVKESNNGKRKSQLSDYWEKANKKNKDDKKQRKICGFVFVPNYSLINQDILNEKYVNGSDYKIIKYKSIYEFFNAQKENVLKDDKYIADFVSALYKHTTDVDEEYRNELLLRFKKRIEED